MQHYFLHQRNKDKWSAATLRIAQSGIKFFFTNVLNRNWHIFTYLNAKREPRLPYILSRQEVYRILSKVKTFHNYDFLSTVYACGLMLSEAPAIQVSDIDKSRMMVHVHRGMWAKDRLVPLPVETLELLRRYWATRRNPVLIFPALGRGQNKGAVTKTPIAIESVQGSSRQARFAAGIKKRRVSIHTLRHCYAIYLLEAGTNPRVIRRYMGHTNLETTIAYFHLTRKGAEDAYAIINNLMKGFDHDNA